MAGPAEIAPPSPAGAPVGRGPTPGSDGRNLRAMRQAAQEFEAVFLSQMFGHVFEGLKTDGVFGGGHAEKVYRTLLVDEYGKTMARAGGIGIGDAVLQQMLRNQETRDRAGQSHRPEQSQEAELP